MTKSLSIVERLKAQRAGGVVATVPTDEPLRLAQATRTAEGSTSYEWDKETRRLVGLLQSATVADSPGITIVNADHYVTALGLDVLEGPSGPRSRSGALQGDLRRLVYE